jgi:hypothetical protein
MKKLIALAALAATLGMSCDSGTNGKSSYNAIPFTIEAPVHARSWDGTVTVDTELNVDVVTAWVNDQQLDTVGTIEKGILRIEIPAVSASYLKTAAELFAEASAELGQELPIPGIETSIEPQDVKIGSFELRFVEQFAEDPDWPEWTSIISAETADGTQIMYMYADKSARIRETADKVNIPIPGLGSAIVSADIVLDLAKGWNIAVSASGVDSSGDVMIVSTTIKTVDELPKDAKWYCR